jgi:hypothetical protein
MNVFLAAQISAAGRIFLFDELERQGENVVYCDTDSIITHGEIDCDKGLGSWRLQMDHGSADLIGPKEYAIHNERLGSVYKAKGIPSDLASEYFRQTRPYQVRELVGLIGPGSLPVEIEPLYLEKVFPPVSLPQQPSLIEDV